MSKNKKSKKEEEKKISFQPFLYMGVILVLVTALLQNVWQGFPEGLRNILYIIGVIALIVYMMQIAFEKRTGKSEPDEDTRGDRLSGRK